jgi:3'-5' exoribonuclease
MTKGAGPKPGDSMKHQWVKDIKEEDRVNGPYLVKSKRLGQTKNGSPFLSLILSDSSGDIESRVWENANELASCFKEGDIIEVEGQAGSYRDQVQLTLSSLKISENNDPAIFLESTSQDISEMMRELRKIAKKIMNADLYNLINSFLSDRSFTDQFKKAPAAKNFHHSYIGGLLEHTLSVCRLTENIMVHYPELDGDLLIAGAFLHDIGKIKEFSYAKGIDYSDEGRLLGHLVLGVSMLEEKLLLFKDFPEETALLLKHLILSHHGEYDFGSPKRPKFLEAFVLHMVDDLDAKMNGLARFMEKDKRDGAWSDFNRMFERYLLKEKTRPLKDEQPPISVHDDRQKALF